MKAEQLLEVPSNTINFLKAAGSIVILCLHYEYLLIYSDQYIPRAEGISQSLQYVFQYGETAVEMFFFCPDLELRFLGGGRKHYKTIYFLN